METNVYVDGSHRISGKRVCNAGAGIYFGDDHPSNMCVGILSESITNSTVEIIAVYIALVITRCMPRVCIFTDSAHCVNPLTVKYQDYVSNGWKNKSGKILCDSTIFINCSSIIESRRKEGYTTMIKKVVGHSNVKGNVIADALASQAVTGSITYQRVITTYLDLNVIVKGSLESSDTINESMRMLSSEKTPDITATSAVYQTNSVAIPTMGDHNQISNKGKGNLPAKLVEVTTNNMFLLCIRCCSMILIKYPSNHPMNSQNGLGKLHESTIAATVCRQCILSPLRNTAQSSTQKIMDEVKEALAKLAISPQIMNISVYTQCAKRISKKEQHILSRNGYIECISIDHVSTLCDHLCTVTSIDTDKGCMIPYLKMGFL